jgi:hypothetical protein
MRRFRTVASLVVVLLLLPTLWGADKSPAPSPSAAAAAEVQNGGIIEGTVTGIDYQRGIVNVGTPRGAVEISVMPTTSVLSSDPGYHAISDVAKGARVQIFTSKVGGRFVAQMIRLTKH